MFTNEIISESKKICIDDLVELERKYNFRFPDDFKSFYLQYNGGKPKRREVYLQDEDWESSTSFHGFYTIKSRLEKKLEDIYEDWWIRGLIPFGYDEGGEDFCFSTRDFDYGCIYYFMSDCLDDENPENALVKVSESFTQFINEMN